MENNHSVESNKVEGPGATLATARNNAGMTQEQVADKLHLSPRQIDALESNRYDDLPEAPYVRGYIRNYALLLKLDAAALVEAFNASRGVKKKAYDNSQQMKAETAKKIRKSDSADMIKFAGIGVIAVLAIVVLVWVSGSGKKKDAVQQTGSSQITDQHFQQTQQQAAELLKGQSQTPTEQVDQPALSAPAAEQSGVPAKQNSNISDSAAITSAPVDQSPAVKPETKTETSSPAAQTGITSQPASRALSQVVLYVEADSWADIRDASDKRLVYETVAGGRVVTIEGKAPIKVFLGNAKAVKLFYNGKEFNFSQYQRGLVARFTLQ